MYFISYNNSSLWHITCHSSVQVCFISQIPVGIFYTIVPCRHNNWHSSLQAYVICSSLQTYSIPLIVLCRHMSQHCFLKAYSKEQFPVGITNIRVPCRQMSYCYSLYILFHTIVLCRHMSQHCSLQAYSKEQFPVGITNIRVPCRHMSYCYFLYIVCVDICHSIVPCRNILKNSSLQA